jgi:hypothetical protein
MVNQVISLRRRGLIQAAPAALIGFGVPVLTVLATEAALAPPRLRVGDRWRYREINQYNGIANGEVMAELVSVTPMLRVKRVHSSGQPKTDEVYVDAWRVVEEPSYDVPISFAQGMPLLPTPLAVGTAEHSQTYYRVAPYEREYFWSVQTKAQAWERLRVPAGDFDCLRIERLIRFSHHDTFRYSSERWDTLWYSPQVNRWVQREWSGYYIMAGGRRGGRAREDWVRWQLLDYIPAPVSQS